MEISDETYLSIMRMRQGYIKNDSKNKQNSTFLSPQYLRPQKIDAKFITGGIKIALASRQLMIDDPRLLAASILMYFSSISRNGSQDNAVKGPWFNQQIHDENTQEKYDEEQDKHLITLKNNLKNTKKNTDRRYHENTLDDWAIYVCGMEKIDQETYLEFLGTLVISQNISSDSKKIPGNIVDSIYDMKKAKKIPVSEVFWNPIMDSCNAFRNQCFKFDHLKIDQGNHMCQCLKKETLQLHPQLAQFAEQQNIRLLKQLSEKLKSVNHPALNSYPFNNQQNAYSFALNQILSLPDEVAKQGSLGDSRMTHLPKQDLQSKLLFIVFIVFGYELIDEVKQKGFWIPQLNKSDTQVIDHYTQEK